MKKLLIIMICLAGAAGSRAQDAAAGFAAKLGELGGKTQSIECAFTLTRTAEFLAAPTVSKGRFYYLRGEGMSLEFTDPAGERITMGRDKFLIVSAGRTNVTPVSSSPMMKQMQKMLEACFTGDVGMLEAGYAVAYSEDGTSYTVAMEPQDKRARKFVKRMTMIFDKADMSLTRLSMEAGSGDVSEYYFFDKKFNGGVDASHFTIE